MRAWWQARRAAQFQRYLGEHPDTVLGALRQSPAMAAAAVTAYYAEAVRDLQAQGVGDRKTAPWPILSQLGHGARYTLASTLPKATPFNLRRFSEYPPARKAINTLVNPILALPWAVQKIIEPGQSRKSLQLTAADYLRIEVASRCLRQPNDDEGWRRFARKILEDMVVGGYGAIETQPTNDPLRPWALYPVDGQSIRINANWDGDAAEPRYSQALAYVGISVGTHEHVQLRDDELIYLQLHPRTNTPFGLGYLEVAFGMINAWLGAFEYAERRASNATPNFGIHLGENVGPEQVRAFRVYWQEQIEGYGNVPITGGGKEASVLDFRSTGEDQLYLKWQEWVVRMIGLAFGLSPLSMSLERDSNRCYDSETEILTLHGWKSHEQLTKDDLIAAVHPMTREIHYMFPKRIYRYAYDGEMIAYQTAFTDVCVTPNHRLWVAKYPRARAAWRMKDAGQAGFGYVLAGELARIGKAFSEVKTSGGICDPLNQVPSRIEIPRVAYGDTGWCDPVDMSVDTETFLKFLGYYISEGGLYTAWKQGPHYLWTLAQKPGAIAENIRAVLQKMPCRVHESFTKRDGCVRWTCSGKSLYTFLHEQCGEKASKKRVPLWVKHVPRPLLQTFFDALMEGDGSWSKKTTPGFNGYYATTSKQLADDVQEIAVKLGYRAQIARHPRQKAPHHHPLYRVLLTKSAEVTCKTENVGSIPYHGTVWCVEVPPYGLFITRRHGKVAIHGNSTAQTMDVQEWDAIAPVFGDLEYYLTEELLWKRFGYRDLEFKMMRKDADELRQAQINELKYTMNMLTIDELREQDELEPLPGGVGGMTKSQYEAWAAASMQGGELPGIGGPPVLDNEYRSAGGDAGVPVEHAPEARPPHTLQAWADLERWRRAVVNGHDWDVSLGRARSLVGRNGSLIHVTDDPS